MKTLPCCLQHLRGCSLLSPLPSPKLQIPVGSDRNPRVQSTGTALGSKGQYKKQRGLARGTIQDRQREGGRGWGCGQPLLFYCLICLENRTFNSVGIPGPAAATSYLLEDSDNPQAVRGRGQDRRIALVALAIQYRPLPAMAAPSASPKTSVQKHHR